MAAMLMEHVLKILIIIKGLIGFMSILMGLGPGLKDMFK